MDTAQQKPRERLQWQVALSLLEDRVFKIRTPRGHGTGFHLGNFGVDKKLCAIATAYHVISTAHDWGEHIKIVHTKTGKEHLLPATDQRGIFIYPKEDLAIIVFTLPEDLILPPEPLAYVSPERGSLLPGVDVGWCGFPGMKNDQLCFFHGYISCYVNEGPYYLVDGVAINGVSGGPIFYIDNESNLPIVAGVITAYIANRETGETLPGLSMIASFSPSYEETLKHFRDLADVTKQAEEQNQANISNEPPAEKTL